MANEPATSGRRETRLLLATIAVSVAMLFLLARFRFPEEARQTAEPAPAPLERLAARATFDELAGIMGDLERRILPAVGTLAGQGEDGSIFVPTVRVSDDRAVAMLSGQLQVRSTGSAMPPTIVLRDAVRDLVVVQAPRQPGSAPVVPAPGTRPGPRYVGIVEAPGGVPAVRPLYVGRSDVVNDPRWPDPLIRIAAVQQTISPGSAVFTLEGTFVGLTVPDGGRVTIVPAATLRNVAVAAPPAPATRSELPFEVQPLTPQLAKAAGASHGVMISDVSDGSLPLASGDVVQAIDGTKVTSVGGYQLLAQSRTPGKPVKLEIVRRGSTQTVVVTALDAAAAQRTASNSDLGAVLRSAAGVGVEVLAVEQGGAANRAGIRRGDLIVAANGEPSPTSTGLLRLYRSAAPGDLLLLTIQRNMDHRVVAVEKR